MRPTALLGGLAMGAALALAAPASLLAEDFPTRPVTWVVPYSPGGITDTGARVIAEDMGKALGQPVVVENRPGSGGVVGTEFVARADADGYTLIYGTQGTMAAAVSLREELRYDPLADFHPLHFIGASHNIVVIPSDRPYKTVQELVDYAKAHPGELNFGSAGVGTSSHLSMELFREVAGLEGAHVPYKGSAPALNDLLAGRIDVLFDYAVSSSPHAEAGGLIAIATNGGERNVLFPDTPTMAEAGFPDATSGSWSMILAPAATPPERIEILTRAAHAAMTSQAVVDYYARYGSELRELEGEEAKAFIAEEIDIWAKVIEAAGVPKQ